jgi:hypothetical protein
VDPLVTTSLQGERVASAQIAKELPPKHRPSGRGVDQRGTLRTIEITNDPNNKYTWQMLRCSVARTR